jgi:hypothetical protein
MGLGTTHVTPRKRSGRNSSVSYAAGESFEAAWQVGPSPLGGYGVFAGRPYCRGDTVEICRSLEVSLHGIAPSLWDYVFGGCREGTGLVVLGYGMLYNHSPRPNLRYESAYEGAVRFVASRRIRTGDELTINYGSAWWRARGRTPMGAARTSSST